jgi:hypothetical protein
MGMQRLNSKGVYLMSKEEYWKNRKAGKRGQGEVPKFVVPERQTETLTNIKGEKFERWVGKKRLEVNPK